MRMTMCSPWWTVLLWASASALDFPPYSLFEHEVVYAGHPHRISAVLPFSVNPEFEPSLLTGSRFHQQAGNLFRIPATPAVDLFTPNTEQQPAETPGQVESYRKALQEEAREAEREANSIAGDLPGGGGGRATSYVSVVFRRGDKIYDYSYHL